MNRSKAETLVSSMKADQLTHPELLAGVAQAITATDGCDPMYKEFFGDFYDESSLFIRKMATFIGEFRGGVFSPDSIKEAFRLSHMIKGASATMGYRVISSMSGGIESLFADVKEGRRQLANSAIDQVESVMSLISEHLEELKTANS